MTTATPGSQELTDGDTAECEELSTLSHGRRFEHPVYFIPGWVITADITNEAKLAYCHLAMIDDGDFTPARARYQNLADLIGLAPGVEVHELLKELVDIDAIGCILNAAGDIRFLIHQVPAEVTR